MNNNNSELFRKQLPVRTYEIKHNDYRKYKGELLKDFNNRCGYCDIKDTWLGGKKVYHIDHFAPKEKFKQLKTEYSNLVYSCPYCNRAKSDHWVTNDPAVSVLNDEGFIDPCDKNYDALFYRDKEGKIISKNKLGDYIHKELHFYAVRHSVVWNLEMLKNLKSKLLAEEKNIMNNEELKSKFIDLTLKYDEYFEYLGDLINE